MNKDGLKNNPEAVKAFKERWGNSLTISRVPPKTLESFKKLAKEEFVDDYGMTLKWIMDLVFGIMPTGNEEIYARLDMIENKLAELTKTPEVIKPKVIRSINGKIIKEI